MSESTDQLREVAVPGAVPRFEIPGWRERFGVVAGITGRGETGGRGFDLGLWTDAPVGETMNRWRAFRSAAPEFSGLVLGHQVHGTVVQWHETTSGWVQLEGLDGHATQARGLLLTVTVADCIPVFLVDPKHTAIALLHAGWRGTAGRILARGVETLVKAAGSRVGDIVIHCGIGICGGCYEVGSEVMQECGEEASGAGPWRLDLRATLRRQAQGLGVAEISTSHWCSAHDRKQFYSHRASRGRDGRMVAYLGIP